MVVLLCFVLFTGLNWKLVQNIWLRPENTSRMISITSKVQVCTCHLENRPRQINQSKFISQRKIDRATFNLATFDQATSRVDQAISNIADKVVDMNPICWRFKIQNQVVRLKWDIEALHLCGWDGLFERFWHIKFSINREEPREPRAVFFL